MLVKNIMKEGVSTISPLARLTDALRIMRDKGVKSLIVNKQHEHDVYGIITYTSIIKAVFAEEGDVELLNVYDISVKPAVSISGEAEVKYAAKMMANIGVKRLLVTQDNKLKGIITISDIMNTLFDHIEDIKVEEVSV